VRREEEMVVREDLESGGLGEVKWFLERLGKGWW
jgi:hypothetical protein